MPQFGQGTLRKVSPGPRPQRTRREVEALLRIQVLDLLVPRTPVPGVVNDEEKSEDDVPTPLSNVVYDTTVHRGTT